MKRWQNRQAGGAHVLIVLVVLVALVGAIGFVVWRAMNKDAGQNAQVQAECAKYNDKDICKFLSSWQTSQKYRMTSTDDAGESIFEVDGDKSRIKMSGENGYEVITIGQTTYTKAGDVWYKQTISEPEDDVAQDYKVDFEQPEAGKESEPAPDKTAYKSHGKEACGKLKCFKYEVVDPDAGEQKQFIWFDDKDYQLRRGRSEGPDGASEQIYEYDNVSVNEPSPVKELGADQYIVPGQPEPMTLPTVPDGLME